MAGLLLSKTEIGKGIRTWTSTNVMESLEANQAKIKLLHKLGSHDVSTYPCRKLRHCLSDTFYTEALRICLWNIGRIFDPVSNPGNSCVVLPKLSQASTWRNAQEMAKTSRNQSPVAAPAPAVSNKRKQLSKLCQHLNQSLLAHI